LLRAAGFKIVLHWMPNLLGATPESDRVDFARLWKDFCPDEIKIYPNQLLANAELYEYWQRGEFHPYTTAQLIDMIADIKPTIPRYCRVNRVIRDIPSTNVVDGAAHNVNVCAVGKCAGKVFIRNFSGWMTWCIQQAG
jgi:elongator complex protein 3